MKASLALFALAALADAGCVDDAAGGSCAEEAAEADAEAMRVELLQVRNVGGAAEETQAVQRRRAAMLDEISAIDEALAAQGGVEASEAAGEETYLLNSHSQRCVNEKLELEDCAWKQSEAWHVTAQGQIKSGSGNCIQVLYNNKLSMAHCNDDQEEQKWRLTDKGYFTMKTKPLQCIDVEGMESTAARSPLVTGLCKFLIPSSDQRFELVPADNFAPQPPAPAPSDNKGIQGKLSVKGNSGCFNPWSLGSTKMSMADCDSAPTWTYYEKHKVLLAPNGYCVSAPPENSYDQCQYSNGDYDKKKYHFKFECSHGKCEGQIKSKKKDGKCLSHEDFQLQLRNCKHNDDNQIFTLH